MPAVVETMFAVGETPWHGQGITLASDTKLSVQEGLEKSGCDWEVGLKDLVTVAKAQAAVDFATGEQNPPTVEPDVKHRAVFRKTDGSILGVVGARWTPLQNKSAFGWFQPFLDAETASLHTAGSLHSGKKVWVLAEINADPIEIAKGDEVARFILLSNSHDGSTAVRVGFTPIRVVCANTLAMAHSNDVSQLIKVRHTANMKVNLDTIRDMMDAANRQFEATAEQYMFLASRQVSVSDLRKYVKIVLGYDKVPDEEIKTRAKNNIDKLIGLCESGRGNVNPAVRGTWWTAYNGATEYFNHEHGRTKDNRLSSLWFGQNAANNKTALETAFEMAS